MSTEPDDGSTTGTPAAAAGESPQLVDVADDVRRAREDVAKLRGKVADLGDRFGEKDRQLVDLGTDVRKTRGEVHALRTTVVDLASTISEWGPHLEDTQKDVAELRGVVDELVSAQAEDANAPVDWFKLPAETAELEWPKLGEWVHEVLGGWYLVTRAQLPDCWALHRPAFLQVAWLRSSHIEAYLSRSHPAQAAEWNVRWLDAALDKIKEYIPDTRCRAVTGGPGQHLVDKLEEAQQGRQRAAAGPTTGGNPYPNPYAQPQPTATPATGPATGGPAGRSSSSAAQEVIRWEYWGEYFNQAMQTDLTWRREREARQAEHDQKATQEEGEKAP